MCGGLCSEWDTEIYGGIIGFGLLAAGGLAALLYGGERVVALQGAKATAPAMTLGPWVAASTSGLVWLVAY